MKKSVAMAPSTSVTGPGWEKRCSRSDPQGEAKREGKKNSTQPVKTSSPHLYVLWRLQGGSYPEREKTTVLDSFAQLKHPKYFPSFSHKPHLKSAFTLRSMVTKRLSPQNYFMDQSSGSRAELLHLGAINPPTLISYMSWPLTPTTKKYQRTAALLGHNFPKEADFVNPKGN